MKKSSNPAKALGKSGFESKEPKWDLFIDGPEPKENAAAIIIDENTAVAIPDDVTKYIVRESKPELVHVMTTDGIEVPVCLIDAQEYMHLFHWVATERRPDVNLNGDIIYCLQINGWKKPQERDAEHQSPLRNPMTWANAHKAMREGRYPRLPPIGIVVEDGGPLIALEELQVLLERKSPLEVVRGTTKPTFGDPSPPREVGVYVLSFESERLFFRRIESSDMLKVFVEGKEMTCMKVAGVKSDAHDDQGVK